MNDAILVGYATRKGSTREVASAIAKTLRDAGSEVELRPLKEVQSLESYRSVILGAPLYMFRWHAKARRFLARHRAALETRPVAVFALGPFHDEEKEWKEVKGQLTSELRKFPWLAPMAQAVFGGAFDPSRLGFPLSLIPALRKMPASDIRDWKVIHDWAASLAAKL